jgi:hypothetical protein
MLLIVIGIKFIHLSLILVTLLEYIFDVIPKPGFLSVNLFCAKHLSRECLKVEGYHNFF